MLCIALLGFRIALPTILKRYVNRTLDRIPEYAGTVGDIDVALIRGAYTIHDVRLDKTTGPLPQPLLSARSVDLSVQWKALFEGKLVGEILFEQAELTFVRAARSSESQTEVNAEWLQAVKDLFPLRINRFELHRSRIRYRDLEAAPHIDIAIDQVEVLGKNLSNTRSPSSQSVATIEGAGRFEESVQLNFTARLNPSAKYPEFDVDAAIEQLPLTRLNELFRAYAGVDAESGKASLFAEMGTKDQSFEGYIKVILNEASFVRWQQDGPNPFKYLWENIVGLFAELFENQSQEQIATTIPFSGRIEDPSANLWSTVRGLARNAFIDALKPGSDKRITFEKVGTPSDR